MKTKDLDRQKLLLGRRLRALRTAKHLTQQQLGEASNVHYKFVGEVERGERWPSTAVLFKLAEALGMPASQLLVVDHEETDRKALVKRIGTKLTDATTEQLQRVLRLLDVVLH